MAQIPGSGAQEQSQLRVCRTEGASGQLVGLVQCGSIQFLDSKTTPPVTMSETKTWMCLICGWIYDEALGDPEHGVAPGTAWADVPMNWTCPECSARKEDFEMVQI
jgi:rubredoxin